MIKGMSAAMRLAREVVLRTRAVESREIRVGFPTRMVAQTVSFEWEPPERFALVSIYVDLIPEPPPLPWRWRWSAWILREVGLTPPDPIADFEITVIVADRRVLAMPSNVHDAEMTELPYPVLVRAGDPISVSLTNLRGDDSLWLAFVGLGGHLFVKDPHP